MILNNANIINYDNVNIKNILINIPEIFNEIKRKTPYQKYLLNDFIQPEVLSNNLYGSPEYEWTILLINQIIDPFWSWPQPDEMVIEMANHKYTTLDTIYLNGIDQVHHHYDPQNPDDIYWDLVEYPNESKYFYNIGDINGTNVLNKISIKEIDKLYDLYKDDYDFITLPGDIKVPPTAGTGDTTYITIPRPWWPQFIGDLVPVTNLEYELNLNETKKQINVIPSSTIKDFVSYISNKINLYYGK